MPLMKRVCVGLLVLLLLLCFVYLFQKQTWLSLTVDNGNGQERVHMTRLPENSSFCIRFKHSVALTPVEEWFVAQNGQVSLRSTVYEDFGAGLPHAADSGKEMTVKDGKVIITGYTLTMHAMYVRVGRIAEHELIVEKEKGTRDYNIRLDTLAKPGKAVKFTIIKDSLLHVLWRYWDIARV